MSEIGLILKTFAEGECIFSEDMPADNAYLITNGAVEISKQKHGQKIIITTKELGEVFGEMALIDDSVRSATATALKETACYVLNENDFTSQMELLHPFLRGIFEKLANIIRSQTDTNTLVQAADIIKEAVDKDNQNAQG